MAGIRVEYFKDAAGKDRVRISGKNGEPMFTSEAYERPGTAREAIAVLEDAFQMGQVEFISAHGEGQAELKGGDDGGAGDDAGNVGHGEPGLE